MKTLLFGSAVILAALGVGTAIAQEAQSANFEPMAAEDWTVGETVVAWIEDYDSGYDHTLMGGVVEDPTDASVVYFATSATDDSGNSRRSIFSYDSDTGFFMRQWRDDNVADTVWNVIGYDTGRIVWVDQAADFQGDECDEPLLRGNDGTEGASLWSILADNLVVNADGTYSWQETASSRYSPTQQFIDEANQRQGECRGGQDTGDTGQQDTGDTGEDTGNQGGEPQ